MLTKEKYIELFKERVYKHMPEYMKMDYSEYIDEYENSVVSNKEEVKESYLKVKGILGDKLYNALVNNMDELKESIDDYMNYVEDDDEYDDEYDEEFELEQSFYRYGELFLYIDNYKNSMKDIELYLQSVLLDVNIIDIDKGITVEFR